MDITLNADGGYIDPNINYINGKYYLWCSKTSTSTQELHLFRSDSILGPYDEVQTNIMNLVNKTGYTWDEAPEMLQADGKYYLYSDPWNKGELESDRDIYRCESTDLMTWSNMQKCNADCTMRHFTPLDIQGLFSTNNGDSNNNDNPIVPTPTPQPESKPQPDPEPSKPSDSNDSPHVVVSDTITLWDGNPGTLNTTNQANFTTIQKLIDHINQLAQTNPLFSEYNISFDLQLLPLLNRNARVQFLNNANLLDKLMPTLMEDILLMAGIIDYEYKKPVIPTALYFDKTLWNNYWQAIADDLNLITKAINQITGGQNQ